MTETTEQLLERLAREWLVKFLTGDKLVGEALPELVREVLRIGREQAAQVADKWAESQSCRYHCGNPCCHVRTGVGIADAIRNLSTEE